MNRYFTISRFARLRGIDINSLRYYERLGILKPAWTDPHTPIAITPPSSSPFWT